MCNVCHLLILKRRLKVQELGKGKYSMESHRTRRKEGNSHCKLKRTSNRRITCREGSERFRGVFRHGNVNA